MTKPCQYFKMAKFLVAIEQVNENGPYTNWIEEMEPQTQVEALANEFYEVSCQYELIDLIKLQ